VLEIDNVESIIRVHGARILEITPDYIVFEKTGHSYETEALFNELKKYDICQFVRSGRAAITKATEEFVTMYLEEQDKRKARYENEQNK
jgi:acetolactate synthase-1/3 small subunit